MNCGVAIDPLSSFEPSESRTQEQYSFNLYSEFSRVVTNGPFCKSSDYVCAVDHLLLNDYTFFLKFADFIKAVSNQIFLLQVALDWL